MKTSHTSSSKQARDGDDVGNVRIVAIGIDQFSGLKGHDYIKARNLNPPVQRVQTSAHIDMKHEPEVCK